MISVTTRQLDVSQVTYASVQNLEKFKRELDTARLEGHSHVTRQTYLSENARDTIDDAVERAHEEQAFNSFQKGEPFPQYVKYEWFDWDDKRFFDVVPALLRLEQLGTKNPMLDCIEQLR